MSDADKPVPTVGDVATLVMQIRDVSFNDGLFYADAFLRKFLIDPHLGGMKCYTRCLHHQTHTAGCYACEMKARNEAEWSPDLKIPQSAAASGPWSDPK